ncbi:MAG: hypothetical protein ACJAR2_000535 [Ilumatobacter sp.]|jgi:hypothetical protein
MALLVPAIAVASSITEPDGVADAAPRSIEISSPGPLGPVTVFGDSVLLGSALFGPTLPERLAERGWGPIRFLAGEGYNTRNGSQTGAPFWIDVWRAQGWDAPNVLINLGANDSGICVTRISCARESIQRVVDQIGPGHQIWWPKITRFFSHRAEEDNWNQALQEFADNRSDFFTWDWPSELPQYPSADGTHLTPDGYRARSVRMADLFTRDMAQARRTGGDAALPLATRTPSTFVSVPAERVIDTRTDGSDRLRPNSTRRIDFGDSLPSEATAVALYIGSARSSTNGFLSATPCGETTAASSVNFRARVNVGAPTIVALGTADDVCIFSSGDTELIVDLQGAFVDDANGLTFTPLDAPARLVDTRETGRADEVVVDVATGAQAVAVNLTAVRAVSSGFLSAYPCGTPSDVASLNFRAESAWAASAIVNVSDDNTICVTTNVAADVIVDITGTFRSGAGLRYVPVTPTRMLDTRFGTGGWAPIHGSDQTLDFRAAPATASAVTGTLTMVKPLDRGFVSADPCAGAAPTSSANASTGSVIANSVTIKIDDAGRLCLLSSATGNTLFDTTGWWVS